MISFTSAAPRVRAHYMKMAGKSGEVESRRAQKTFNCVYNHDKQQLDKNITHSCSWFEFSASISCINHICDYKIYVTVTFKLEK